jgi:RNA polymerase sigma-70 factor (ECF subfamily)
MADESGVSRLCEVGAAAWPRVRVEADELAQYLAARGEEAPDPQHLSDDAAAELYLACACARGDETALARFDARFLDVVPAALAHMKLPAATVDEVRQMVREKLLVVDGDGVRKLDRYAGQGKLRGLIKVVAVRTAISVLRKTRREAPLGDDALAAIPTPEHDPELAYMKARYRSEFKIAFEVAARQLESRDRNLLRLHLLDGVTLEQIAEMYSVHRATVVRWLAKVRDKLFSNTRKHMRERLDVSPEEFESLMGLIQSRLDVSVQRMLQTRDDGAE